MCAMLAAFISLMVSFAPEDSLISFFASKDRWQSRGHVTWFDGNCKQPGCSCRVMETLPRGNEWKLMTTGGAAKAQVLDSCPLAIE